MNASELLAEMESEMKTRARKPCAVCALPEPYIGGINLALQKGTASIPVILDMLERHNQPKPAEKRFRLHRRECLKRG